MRHAMAVAVGMVRVRQLPPRHHVSLSQRQRSDDGWEGDAPSPRDTLHSVRSGALRGARQRLRRHLSRSGHFGRPRSHTLTQRR
jgi:hypothetical protein